MSTPSPRKRARAYTPSPPQNSTSLRLPNNLAVPITPTRTRGLLLSPSRSANTKGSPASALSPSRPAFGSPSRSDDLQTRAFIFPEIDLKVETTSPAHSLSVATADSKAIFVTQPNVTLNVPHVGGDEGGMCSNVAPNVDCEALVDSEIIEEPEFDLSQRIDQVLSVLKQRLEATNGELANSVLQEMTPFVDMLKNDGFWAFARLQMEIWRLQGELSNCGTSTVDYLVRERDEAITAQEGLKNDIFDLQRRLSVATAPLNLALELTENAHSFAADGAARIAAAEEHALAAIERADDAVWKMTEAQAVAAAAEARADAANKRVKELEAELAKMTVRGANEVQGTDEDPQEVCREEANAQFEEEEADKEQLEEDQEEKEVEARYKRGLFNNYPNPKGMRLRTDERIRLVNTVLGNPTPARKISYKDLPSLGTSNEDMRRVQKMWPLWNDILSIGPTCVACNDDQTRLLLFVATKEWSIESGTFVPTGLHKFDGELVHVISPAYGADVGDGSQSYEAVYAGTFKIVDLAHVQGPGSHIPEDIPSRAIFATMGLGPAKSATLDSLSRVIEAYPDGIPLVALFILEFVEYDEATAQKVETFFKLGG